MICEATMDLGCEDDMFNTLSGNLDDYLYLGYCRGYDPSIGPYCLYLEDFPRKAVCTAFFNHSYDSSKKFDKVKMILIVSGVIFVIVSYFVFSKLWSQEFNRLLYVLMASNLKGRLLRL